MEGVGNIPPQNLEAEQWVLGAILIDQEALHRVIDIIGPGDFYKDSHRKLFTAMMDLFDRNEAIDLVTVSEALSKKDELDAVGGANYLALLASSVPTSANIRHHAQIIKEKATLRALLRSANEIAGKVYEDSSDADELLDFAEKLIFDISDRRINTSFSPLKDVVKESMQMIESLYEKKDSITGVPSGFTELDELTTGFHGGELIVVGGRPSMGKTAFALNIAQHVAIEYNEPVAIFSLEMSKKQLALRMLCSEAMVDSNLVRKGFIKNYWHKLTEAAGKLTKAPIFIDDSSGISALEMRAKARRLKKEHGLSLVIVDYLQLMRGRGNFERREQEISDISRSLKALAKELDIPVVALSQLNREVEKQKDSKRPTLAHLRESGAIEQDADVIIFLHREEVYDRDNPNKKGKAEVIVAKQRNGPTDTIRLTYLSKCTKFTNYIEGYYPEEEVSEPYPEGGDDPF